MIAELGQFGGLAAILTMAAATLLLRIGGFWLMAQVPLTPRVRRMLDALPGSVIVATVAPMVETNGLPAVLGVAVVVGLMALWRNDFLAVAGGVAAVALTRAAGL